jgi:hypothetical protein
MHSANDSMSRFVLQVPLINLGSAWSVQRATAKTPSSTSADQSVRSSTASSFGRSVYPSLDSVPVAWIALVTTHSPVTAATATVVFGPVYFSATRLEAS